MSDSKTVDCRSLPCPQPVIETKKALEEGTRRFDVLVDNEGALENVMRFVRSRRCAVNPRQEKDYFVISVSAPGAPAEDGLPALPGQMAQKNGEAQARSVILLTADVLGGGDDRLGARLMESALDTLGNFVPRLSRLVLINGAVRLAAEGSPQVEQLQALEKTGVEILVCGTCVKFYGLEGKLACGRISNMYEIVELLLSAPRVLRL